MEADSTKPLPQSAALRAALLRWYDAHGRDLPWRILPAARKAGAHPDAYRVWLGEVMAQQTTLAVVRGYHARFIARWPDVNALAQAAPGDVLSAWAGLGYYARARNLHACAQRVVRDHGGVFPQTETALRTLPGIGAYTAAAMAALVHGAPANVVDGNIERIMARLHAVQTPLPAAKKQIFALAAHYVRKSRAADWPQALMDLGALVCRPKTPDCPACPVRAFCRAGKAGEAAGYPRRAARKARPVRHGAAFVLVRDGAVLLRRRPAKGLLGGMSEVPGTDWREQRRTGAQLLACAPLMAPWRATGQVRHVFTHFALELEVFCAPAPADYDTNAGWWAAAGALQGEALPSLMRKVLTCALGTAR